MFEHERVPNCFYRISIKALILDSEGRFLLCKEENGWWDLPGGGLHFGESPIDGLKREVKEEMGVTVTSVGQNPEYFLTFRSHTSKKWAANILYRVTVADYVITPSSECTEIKFFTKEEAIDGQTYESVKKFAALYSVENHGNEKSP